MLVLSKYWELGVHTPAGDGYSTLDAYHAGVSFPQTEIIFISLESHSTGVVQYTRLKKSLTTRKAKMVASVVCVGIDEGHG